MSRNLRPTRHIIRHFGYDFFQAIHCSDTDNQTQPRQNMQKKHKINKKTQKLTETQTNLKDIKYTQIKRKPKTTDKKRAIKIEFCISTLVISI